MSDLRSNVPPAVELVSPRHRRGLERGDRQIGQCPAFLRSDMPGPRQHSNFQLPLETCGACRPVWVETRGR